MAEPLSLYHFVNWVTSTRDLSLPQLPQLFLLELELIGRAGCDQAWSNHFLETMVAQREVLMGGTPKTALAQILTRRAAAG